MGRYDRSAEALSMKIKRVWFLLKNEVLHGPKDVILVMSVLIPVLLALFVNLAFGNIFTERPKMGIYDQGQSALAGIIRTNSSFIIKEYKDETDLKSAASRGTVDVGVVLPADFDTRAADNNIVIKAYVWGESQAKSRTLIPIALASAARQIAGSELPVQIETRPLGNSNSQPWSNRLIPLIILLAVFFGGLMIPASSLINEKNRRTLEALYVTPVTLREIFASKGIIGIMLAIIMGALTLTISSGFNNSWGSVMLVLVMGAMMAAAFGLLAGALVKDMNTLYALWKFGGLLLFAPAIIYMFPQIPQWIGYFFPTFYIIKPVVDLTLNGSALSSVVWYLMVVVVLISILFVAINFVIRRLNTKALQLNG
jgi:ABC-2 type transport system permease protein